jgi:hypothetical protein
MWFCKKNLEKKVEKINDRDRFDKTCYIEKHVTDYGDWSDKKEYETYDQVEYSGQVVKLPDGVILYEIREPVKRDYVYMSGAGVQRAYRTTWVSSKKLHFPESVTNGEA